MAKEANPFSILIILLNGSYRESPEKKETKRPWKSQPALDASTEHQSIMEATGTSPGYPGRATLAHRIMQEMRAPTVCDPPEGWDEMAGGVRCFHESTLDLLPQSFDPFKSADVANLELRLASELTVAQLKRIMVNLLN